MKKRLSNQFNIVKYRMIFAFLLTGFFVVQQANATTFEVSNLNASGSGSLKQAVLDANAEGGSETHIINFVSPVVGGDVIELNSGFDNSTNNALYITCNLVINGPMNGGIVLKRTTVPMRLIQSAGGTNVVLNNLIIQDGAPSAGSPGGGVLCNGIMSVQDCTIKNNKANADGPGISVDQFGAELILNNTLVQNNSGNTNGNGNGAVYVGNGSKLTVTNSVIEGNTSYGGGGIFVNCGPSESQLATVNNTIIRNNNTSGEKGGGVNVQWGTLYISNSEISGNTSAAVGGGFGLNGDNNARVVINNCTISGNTASQGGGIYTYNNAGFNITNTTISGNTASDNYGGMSTGGGTTDFKNLNNVTVTKNNCLNSGGAGFIVGGWRINGENPVVNYSIFSGNTTANSADNKRLINISGSISSTAGGNIFGNELNDPNGPDVTYSSGVTTGTLYPTADPSTILSPTLADNGGTKAGITGSETVLKTHELVTNSPAIDIAGDSYTLAKDQRGFDRDENVDAGAFEFIESVSVSLNGEFKVRKTENSAVINWSTLSEVDNDFFLLDRSTDGINFTTIDKIYSKGNISYYTVYDNKPLSGLNYYRLSQVDLDGKSTVLGTKSLNFDFANNTVQIYPNPVIENIYIDLKNYNKSVLVKIIDQSGKQVYVENINGGSNQYKLKMTKKLTHGIYIVNISGEGLNIAKQIIVQ